MIWVKLGGYTQVIPHKCLTKNSGMKNMITKKKSR